jgi:hypothetical protein
MAEPPELYGPYVPTIVFQTSGSSTWVPYNSIVCRVSSGKPESSTFTTHIGTTKELLQHYNIWDKISYIGVRNNITLVYKTCRSFNLSFKRWLDRGSIREETSKIEEVAKPCQAHWHDLTKLLKCNILDVKKQLKLDHEASSSINIKWHAINAFILHMLL